MTSVLEKTLDLPSLQDALAEQGVDPKEELDKSKQVIKNLKNALATTQEIEKTVADIGGFEGHDLEMDEIADRAMTWAEELMELGMNVEVRHAGSIFDPGSALFKIALEAKNAKVDKKLRLAKLRLDELRLEHQIGQANDGTIDGDAIIFDRNNLLKELKEANQDE